MDKTLQMYIDKLNKLNFKEMYEGAGFLQDNVEFGLFFGSGSGATVSGGGWFSAAGFAPER